jgi:exodeoxyribonuclease-5
VTRQGINRRMREILGFLEPAPMVGERLVCLRNDNSLGIFNGSQWTVVRCSPDYECSCAEMIIRADEEPIRDVVVTAWLHHFMGRSAEMTAMGPERRDMSELDFGYCLTVHKGQGGQWPSVCLIDESATFGEIGRRWGYTGVTRAIEKLTVISG